MSVGGRSWPANAVGIAPGRPAIMFMYPELLDEAPIPVPVLGQYHPDFITKVLPHLGCERREVLHVCSGALPKGEGIRVDVRADAQPDYVCDGRALPFKDGSIAGVLIDPPYTPDYARELYGTEYPRPAHLLREAARVVRAGGRIAFLHYHTPNPPPLLQVCAGLGRVAGIRFPDAGAVALREGAGLAPARGAA